MLPRDYASENCSIARALEVVGDRWTLLIVRSAFFACTTRFGDFASRLDIARDVLADRLNRLSEDAIFERRAYQDRPPRHEYLLTDKGRDLVPVLAAMTNWGDRYRAPQGPPREIIHFDCGGHVDLQLVCRHCLATVPSSKITSRAGPGARQLTDRATSV